MTPSERHFVRIQIALLKPDHLNGFDEGWLLKKQINFRFGKVIQLFSIENDKANIVVSVVC